MRREDAVCVCVCVCVCVRVVLIDYSNRNALTYLSDCLKHRDCRTSEGEEKKKEERSWPLENKADTNIREKMPSKWTLN